jgi:hypothetical protein
VPAPPAPLSHSQIGVIIAGVLPGSINKNGECLGARPSVTP